MAQTKDQIRLAAKRRRLWELFRITPEEEARTELFQRNHPVLSVLLEGSLKNPHGKLYNDHNHLSGAYRGRLGYLINKALGTIENSFKERTPVILRALAEYLENPPAIQAIGTHYGLLGRAVRKKKMEYGPNKKGRK